MELDFGGRVLVLGCGSVSQCLQPLLLKHLRMDYSKLTILDFEDNRAAAKPMLEAGARYVQDRVTKENLASLLGEHVGPGDLLVDLAWNIDCNDITQWCHDNDVMYVNTSVEEWDPYSDATSQPPTKRSLYHRHRLLRAQTSTWRKDGPTIVVEHGANPGLVSHWTKVALLDIADAILRTRRPPKKRRAAIEAALESRDFARLAMHTGVKVIHISERDTQIADRPKEVDEFVNTWSVEGFREEGVAPAELGWGTHERSLPPRAHTYDYGTMSQICLAQPGMDTWVRSWVPLGGEIRGMVIRHGEALTITEALTVWEDGRPIYRPTVHYAYLPTDAAIASLLELRMRNYQLQPQVRIMTDEIVSGRDELGVLLMGHDLTSWWTGSQLDIEETRRLVPGQNATTLQVAASVLGALAWMIRNPRRGFNVPDDLPHEDVLAVAGPYLGPCPSVQSDWTPLRNRVDLFDGWGGTRRPPDDDVWQFSTFLA
ncbi:MAG TPA: saccharopine dehydrogenase C-terminal domain-containing protein [Acidimicrobiales bacterium]